MGGEDAAKACAQPPAGEEARQPESLWSQAGVLKADLYFHRLTDSTGHIRYCYLSATGNPSPTLRVNPGDLLVLELHNEIAEPKAEAIV